MEEQKRGNITPLWRKREQRIENREQNTYVRKGTVNPATVVEEEENTAGEEGTVNMT